MQMNNFAGYYIGQRSSEGTGIC